MYDDGYNTAPPRHTSGHSGYNEERERESRPPPRSNWREQVCEGECVRRGVCTCACAYVHVRAHVHVCVHVRVRVRVRSGKLGVLSSWYLFVTGAHVSVGVGLECASVRARMRALCLLVRANVCVFVCVCKAHKFYVSFPPQADRENGLKANVKTHFGPGGSSR